jgi:choline dehydrogenase-like flavoprotein
MLPSLFLPMFPWTSGLEWKELTAKFRNLAGFVAINRDRDPGRVFPDPVDGRCRIEYTPSQFDRDRTINGVLALCKIAYVTGATEILTGTQGVPSFIRQSSLDSEIGDQGVNDPAFVKWLEIVRAKGLPLPEASFASAHQMGTCRMGSSPKNSVVDPDGKVWGTEGLYVCDASIFPSASGVNPMVTNMGIADWMSRGLARGLRERSKL